MKTINNYQAFDRALSLPLDDSLKALLRVRRQQLLGDDGAGGDVGGQAHFIIVEPPDDIATIEAAAGYPIITSPAFEWVADHAGWFEAVTILSDEGSAVVLLVPDVKGVDGRLLNLLRRHARQASMSNPSFLEAEHRP